MELDTLINTLMEIRAKNGNIEVSIWNDSLNSNSDWMRITNVEVVNGDEEEMTSDWVMITVND